MVPIGIVKRIAKNFSISCADESHQENAKILWHIDNRKCRPEKKNYILTIDNTNWYHYDTIVGDDVVAEIRRDVGSHADSVKDRPSTLEVLRRIKNLDSQVGFVTAECCVLTKEFVNAYT